MGVVDDLVKAREDYERGDWADALAGWSAADADQMTAADLHAAAVSAYLLGRLPDALTLYGRAFRLYSGTGDLRGAVRCAFHLSMIHATAGEPSLAAGWTARAARLVDGPGGDVAQRGYVSFLQAFACIRDGAMPAAASYAVDAVEHGRRHRDSDLLALGLCSAGRIAIHLGRVAEGLASLDESMAVLSTGEVSPEISGNVYCTAIEGCQQIEDLGRVSEWTSALHRWCAAFPALVTFTGQCSLHRGQVMRRHGAWAEALDELARALERYRAAGSHAAAGVAECERGDLLRLRGEWAAAETAYQRAADLGHDPQPGLALLWLATGRPDAAVGAVRRLLLERSEPVGRCALLPGAVEVLLAAGTHEEARAAAQALEEVATHLGTTVLQAASAEASGAVELAGGDPAGGLPYLRKAAQLWTRLEEPFELARTRVLAGQALRALGDAASARTELEAAAPAFRALGAVPASTATERLLVPSGLPAGLTAREVEVLRLVATGCSNAAIATRLVLSEKTVARHLSNIFAKIDVGSRTAAAAYAFEHGLA